jgi:sulfate adenylyltransferase subunit 1 (EFTu-like GTPase family)
MSIKQIDKFPVQDIYKISARDDDRRIVAGTVATGSISVGKKLSFFRHKKIAD